MTELRETARALLDYCSSDARLVPNPTAWNALYKKLRNTKQKPSGGWKPTLPLILGAWNVTSDADKRRVFEEHIRWADGQGQLNEIGAFLRSLPDGDWIHNGEI